MIVHFKGGPLGGETRSFPNSFRHELRVPAFSFSGRYISDYDTGPNLIPETMYTTESYELRPCWSKSGPELEFEGIWVNPNAGLIKERDELKQRVEQLEAVKGVLDSVEHYFRDRR